MHDKCIFFVQIRRLLLTLETTDNLCLVYSNVCANEIIFKVLKQLFTDYFSCRDLSKLSLKYQSSPKSTKIEAFEQKICIKKTMDDFHAFRAAKFL